MRRRICKSGRDRQRTLLWGSTRELRDHLRAAAVAELHQMAKQVGTWVAIGCRKQAGERMRYRASILGSCDLEYGRGSKQPEWKTPLRADACCTPLAQTLVITPLCLGRHVIADPSTNEIEIDNLIPEDYFAYSTEYPTPSSVQCIPIGSYSGSQNASLRGSSRMHNFPLLDLLKQR